MLCRNVLGVAKNLWLRRVFFGPSPFSVQLGIPCELVIGSCNIAASPGVTVPIPSSTDVASSLEDTVRETVLTQFMQQIHASKTSSDNNDIDNCGINNLYI
jgi:hypothetical protein